MKLTGSSRCSLATLVLAAIITLGLAPEQALAQVITVDQRVIIDFGPAGETLLEPCISATPNRRVAVCKATTSIRGYTQGNQSSSWRAGSISTILYPDVCSPSGGFCGTPINPSTNWVDPSCANVLVDGQPSGSFVALVETRERVAISRLSAASGWSDWATVSNPTSGTNPDTDKPWIVAGSDNELYAVYMQVEPVSRYHFGRSIDGGNSWEFQPVQVGGLDVGGRFCAQPVVVDDEGCYLSITPQSGSQTQILRYSDATSSFGYLSDSSGAPISISHNSTLLSGLIAGGYQCSPVPWIVGIRPTVEGPTSLFVVRPEVAAGGGDDVDLYCQRLQNLGAGGSWIVNATWECRAPDADLPDANGDVADQFCQAAEIDRWGAAAYSVLRQLIDNDRRR